MSSPANILLFTTVLEQASSRMLQLELIETPISPIILTITTHKA
jgi:hypothetical protein